MLRLLDVSKSFGAHVAVESATLSIREGSTSVLIGPSGCGKSTLLRLMIGLLWPDTGSVEFAGRRLVEANVLEARRRMGYVIQDGGLFPHLTARRNVSLMARHLGWTNDRTEARIRELADLTRFPLERLDRFPVQLSGGQRQRVSLMRALMLDPELLLLDEPLGALDPMIRADLQVDLRRIFRQLGKTVVMVTHDIAEAGYFGDEIILLRDGRIVQRGSLEDLLEAPEGDFVTRFVNAQRDVSGLSGARS